MRRLLDKLQNKDKNAKKPVAHSSAVVDTQENVRPLSPVVAITAAAPSVGNDNSSHTAAATGTHKQVAFAAGPPAVSSPALSSATDAQSLVSHHQPGLSCFPTRPTSAVSQHQQHHPQHGTRHQHTPTPLNTASLHIPSHPIRHVSLDAGPRTTAVSSPAFSEAITDPMLRSGTALSYSTVTTSAGTPSPTFGSIGNSNLIFGTSAATAGAQPNLTILANYSRDHNLSNGGGEIVQHLTWSEIVNDELVDNLGGRERTRQEVLFEMVCSEERYVQDLIAFRDSYLLPLLRSSQAHDDSGYATIRSTSSQSYGQSSPKRLPSEPPTLTLATIRAASATPSRSQNALQDTTVRSVMSNDHLPIAARFARRQSIESTFGSHAISTIPSTSTGRSSSSGENHSGHTKSRDASGSTGKTSADGRGHAVDSGDETDASSLHHQHNHARKSAASDRLRPLFVNGNASKISTISETSPPSPDLDVPVPRTFKHHLRSLGQPPPHKLHKTGLANILGDKDRELPLLIPEDLRIVCETIVNNLLDGHQGLVAKLKARYEEQYPLVRTLADVFSNQAWMIQHYASYVLHLEKALHEIEEILETANPLVSAKKRMRDKDAAKEQKRLAKTIIRLEEQASMKGQPCLSICLSQPFQRLLKYPLMFQSLLYHTDHCLKDYEATQKLAIEIDAIVRSIESQKATEDDRLKTRDCWARIEGIKEKALLIPRPDRMLISEIALWATTSPSLAAARRTFPDAGRESVDVTQLDAAAKNKTIRRLSDMIGPHATSKEKASKQPSMGSKRDIWLVKFSDVILRCRRIGVTRLPLSGSTGSSNGNGSIRLMHRDRNLYRFVQIDRWAQPDANGAPNQHIQEIDRLRESQRATYQDAMEEDSDEEDAEGYKSAPEISTVPTQRSPVPVFDIDPLVGLNITPVKAPASTKKTGKRVVSQAPSATTQQVLRREGAATVKFGNRVRPSLGELNAAGTPRAVSKGTRPASPHLRSVSAADTSSPRAKPIGGKATAASTARAAAIRQRINSGKRGDAATPTPDSKRIRATSANSKTAVSPPLSPEKMPLPTSRPRRRSFSGPSADGTANKVLRTKHSSEKLGMHGRQPSDTGSGVVLFNQYWQKGSTTSVNTAA